MLERLNDIIAEEEKRRDRAMPRIGAGHAGFPGGIFSLLQDPGGGGVHTPDSGAVGSGCVDIDNDDPTANWSKELFRRLGIPKSAVTPWNAFGAYGEKPGMRAIAENLSFCQRLLDAAAPAAMVAQGRWARKMADRLRFAGPVFCVAHPSRRGRASYRGAAEDIESAFRDAYDLVETR